MISLKQSLQFLFLINTICTVLVIANEYTNKEKAALEKFRASIPDIIAQDDYYQNDHFLIRWLRARNLDVASATTMIRKADKWRKDNRIDNLENEPNPLQLSTPVFSIHGKDKEGRPILFLTPTSIDLRAVIVSGKRDKAMRAWDQLLETTYKSIRNATINGERMKNGEEITQVVAILDVHGFNPRQHMCVQCVEFFHVMLQEYEDFYPGALKYFVFINGEVRGQINKFCRYTKEFLWRKLNRVAVSLSHFVGPVLTKATRKTLRTFSSDKDEWQNFLRSIIDEDELPFRFGGRNKKLL